MFQRKSTWISDKEKSQTVFLIKFWPVGLNKSSDCQIQTIVSEVLGFKFGIGWMRGVPGDLLKDWKTLVIDLRETKEIRFPRPYCSTFSNEAISHELRIFWCVTNCIRLLSLSTFESYIEFVYFLVGYE